MDEQQHATQWQFDSNTPQIDLNTESFDLQAFDALWTELDDVDFQFSAQGISTTTSNTENGVRDFSLLDDPAITNFSPTEHLDTPYQDDVFDFATIQHVITAPRQRTLPRRRSKYILRREGTHISPIPITSSHQNSSFEPVAIERWQNSPPEDEAASLSAIYNAMEQRPLSRSGSGTHTPNFDQYRTHRVPSSTTSLDSGVSDSSVHSVNSKGSSKSQRRRRSAKPRTTTSKGKAKPKDSADRIFKCTFCCDTFKVSDPICNLHIHLGGH